MNSQELNWMVQETISGRSAKVESSEIKRFGGVQWAKTDGQKEPNWIIIRDESGRSKSLKGVHLKPDVCTFEPSTITQKTVYYGPEPNLTEPKLTSILGGPSTIRTVHFHLFGLIL